MQSLRGTLATGDYSLKGLEDVVAIERKSLSDLLACVGRERKRFDREVQRLLGYSVRAIVVESTWKEIEAGDWQSKVSKSSALGSLLGWIAAGVPIVMAGDRNRAGQFVSRLLYFTARRRYREAKQLLEVQRLQMVAEHDDLRREAAILGDEMPYDVNPNNTG